MSPNGVCLVRYQLGHAPHQLEFYPGRAMYGIRISFGPTTNLVRILREPQVLPGVPPLLPGPSSGRGEGYLARALGF